MKSDNKNLIIGLSITIAVLLGVILFLVLTRDEKPKNTIDKAIYMMYRENESSYIYGEKKGIVNTYDELISVLEELDFENTDPYSVLPKSSFSNYSFIYYATTYDNCNEDVTFKNVTLKNYKATINFDVDLKCGVCAPEYLIYLIAINKEDVVKIDEIEPKFTTVSRSRHCDEYTVDKPILYLYPEKNMNVTVKIKHSDRISTSYPKYNNGWKVLATPNGDLYDKDNNYYYALYWDELKPMNVDFSEGFYVTKENAIFFLEEKLSIIGLNDRERNEFIMYWLPKLEQNEKSLVYFELTEERQKNNELIINPKPDSLLRVNMHIKKIENEVKIKEQTLKTFERKGFVAVEWGGTIH